MRTTIRLAGPAVAAVLALAACSSSGGAGGSGGGGAGGGADKSAGDTITLGVLTDTTGVAASGFSTTEKGVKAYVDAANKTGGIAGHKIKYVMADSQSTLAGALTAVQKLVERDHVFAVINVSSVFYGATAYTLRQGVPVVGGGFDGPEWSDPKNTNLFSAGGTNNFDGLSTTTGLYMKSRGVTNCGSIGYASSISSQKAASGGVDSCKAVGLKGGYLNTQVPFGSTDVGAIALAIKKAGVDGLSLPVVPNTAFALAGALQRLGVKMKSVLLATGYGGDLLQSKPAVAAAQGYEFSSVGFPIETDNAATKKFATNLAAAGVTGTPTFAEQEAYISMAAFAAGLEKAGGKPTQGSFIKALRSVSDFDAEGLLAPAKVDFSNFKQIGAGGSTAGCIFAAKLEGSKFVPVGAAPVCGKNIK